MACPLLRRYNVFNAVHKGLKAFTLPDCAVQLKQCIHCPICLLLLLIYSAENDVCFCSNRSLLRIYRQMDCMLLAMNLEPDFTNDRERMAKVRSRGPEYKHYLSVIKSIIHVRSFSVLLIYECPLWKDILAMKFCHKD